MVALQLANITSGSFNVEVPLAEPIVPPDAEWFEEIGARLTGLNASNDRMKVVGEISRKQLDEWEPLCGDLGWTFNLGDARPEDRAEILAGRFAEGHERCACRTSAERWATLFYAINFGASPAATTTDGDYRVELSPDGVVTEFAPDEEWGATVQRFPAPGSEPTKLWLAEATGEN